LHDPDAGRQISAQRSFRVLLASRWYGSASMVKPQVPAGVVDESGVTSTRKTAIKAGVGAGLLGVLTGCSALLGATPVPSTSAVPQPSYSVAVVTVPTPKPRTAAPALKTTGTAWPAILASLAGYGQWVLANPDPSKVANVALPGCAMYDLLSRQTTAMFEEQAYLQPSAPAFGLVTGPSPAPGSTIAVLGNQLTLDVSATRSSESVLSRSKATPISAFDALPTTALRITLNQGTDKRWRFCTVNAWSDTGEPDDPSVALL
jgi:hypothetical protein